MHAKLIAPEDVCIYDHPKDPIPDYADRVHERIVLIFPSDEARTLPEMLNENDDRPLRAVFIDGTWRSARQLARHPSLANMPKVSINKFPTVYWRYQTGEKMTHLATIEVVF